MIRLTRIQTLFLKINFSLLLFCSWSSGLAQVDIWNDKSTLKYGNYLYEKGEYIGAAHEFQRYIYHKRNDTGVVSKWIRAYAKGGQDEIALSELESWNQNTAGEYAEIYRVEKAWLLLKLKRFNEHTLLVESIQDSWKYKKLHQNTSIMLQGRWDEAEEILFDKSTTIDQKLYEIAHNAAAVKYKSPALAGVMAAVIPGTGKVYVGKYVDGIISMVFVGTMTFQAVRFFQKQGTGSLPGWIFTGLGGAYYAAGIYGSVKAAKDYNQLKQLQYEEAVNNLLYSIY